MMVAKEEVDRRVLVSAADSVTGTTPLMFATIENRMQMMERLLALGCDINKRNKENYTALHFGRTPNHRLCTDYRLLMNRDILHRTSHDETTFISDLPYPIGSPVDGCTRPCSRSSRITKNLHVTISEINPSIPCRHSFSLPCPEIRPSIPVPMPSLWP